MADIYFYQDDDDHDDDVDAASNAASSSLMANNNVNHLYDEGEGTGGAEACPPVNPDDLLPPVKKLEKYAVSENLFDRQIVARTILETLRSSIDDENDVDAVLNVMNRLADDAEPGVRAELMEQIPHIAMFCQEAKPRLSFVVPDYLLPMVVKFLTDSNNQVRKTSQAALLVLLEQGLVEREDVREQVCPVIIKLTESDSLDDYKTEAVALLSKMAPLIGKEMVESLFLERFAALCVDPVFHVRKLCAANFGDFCSVVGSEATEKILLPKFYYLCDDGIWGVRKACADVFMPVSCVCSSSVRQLELAPVFINLLRDQSRWVRMAAFQALGPFISTFADPSITELLQNDNGEIVIKEPDVLAERLAQLEIQRAKEKESKKVNENSDENGDNSVIKETPGAVPEQPNDNDKMDISNEDSSNQSDADDKDDLSLEEKRAKVYLSEKNEEQQSDSKTEEQFNSFVYWRDPLLSLDELEFKEKLTDSLNKLQIEKDEDENEEAAGLRDDDDEEDTSMWRKLPIITFQTFDDLTDSSDENSTMELFRPTTATGQGRSISTFEPRWDTLSNVNAESTKSDDMNTNPSAHDHKNQAIDPVLPRGPPLTEQSIVPQLLIDHYVSMTDPSRAQTVDTEIARHCAFSLPAVALTLGRSNWPLLKSTYETLATDMQWKVRRTLASSIHELGVILGEESSGTDLIPIFDGFLKDLDEVRQGLLKHLADFFKLLSVDNRRDYLPKLSEFLKMDNDRNWRFRQELSDQLERLIPLYEPSEVEEFISPIAMVLVQDKVSAVRESAIKVIASILRALTTAGQKELALNLVDGAIVSLAEETLWVHRQTFAKLCLNIFHVGALDSETFTTKLLLPLLVAAEDSVANVRLAAAKTLSTINKQTDFLLNDNINPHHERMLNTERNLKNDVDVDVREFYGGLAKVYGNYQSAGEISDDEFGSLSGDYRGEHD